MSKVDVKNFMGVLGATEQTETGIRFPGAHMPSGNPVTAEGVTKAQLMTDKNMAQSWHDSIVGQYEREKNERNHAASTADAPELSIVGPDGDAAEPGASSKPAPVHSATLEEELQTREEVLLNRIEELARAKKELKAVQAALEALRGSDDE